jgi:hypothetical protein
MAEKTPENSTPEKKADTLGGKTAAPKKKPAKSAKSTTATKKKTTAAGTKGGAKKKKSAAAKSGDSVKKTPAAAKKKTAASKKKPAPKKASATAEKKPTETDTATTKPAEAPPEPAQKATVATAAETVKTTKPEKTEKPKKPSPPPPSYTPPPAAEPEEPVNKAIKYSIIGFCVLVLLIVGHSIRNTNKYYVLARHGAIEIWQGSFSPMGKELLLVMPGVQAPAKTKEVYRQSDVFPLIFNFYIEKADTLMDVPGSPDFVGIKKALNQAMSYAINTQMRKTAIAKIDSIDRMILVYKADAAAGRGTVDGLHDAQTYLKRAAALRPGEIEAKLISEKLDSVQKQLNLLQPGKAVTPKKEQPKPAVKSGPDQADDAKEKQEPPIKKAPEKKSSQDV